MIQALRATNTCLVRHYSPGLVVVHEQSASAGRPLTRLCDLQAFKGSAAFIGDPFSAVDSLCKAIGLTDSSGDLNRALRRFSGEFDLEKALDVTITTLGAQHEDISTAGEKLLHLVDTLCIDVQDEIRCRSVCHDPGASTSMEDNATHFGYVLEGCGTLTVRGFKRSLDYPVYANTYFCVPGAAILNGNLQAQVITRFGLNGQFVIGGEIGDWGRLKYIDGCTDSLLVPPAQLGYPCLNALYFPESTRQTPHTHPTLRLGMVVGGQGICKAGDTDIPLRRGDIFVLPPDTWHAFVTNDRPTASRAALTVVAFHPDSDFGPSDENHPMANRTFFKVYHRLESLVRMQRRIS